MDKNALLVGGSIAVVASGILLAWISRKRKVKDHVEAEVLFFPDKVVACKDHFVLKNCRDRECRYSHKESSLSRLYVHIASAKQSLNVCVFCITCRELAEILIMAHKRGVVVRVITDDEQTDTQESRVWQFRKEGIQVRTDRSSYFMHHKFVVIDGKRLLNGSFNWTRNAITGNQENLLIIEDTCLVSAYLKEFNTLWQQFDPQNFYRNASGGACRPLNSDLTQ